LACMTDLTGFFSHAWKTITRAIMEAGVKAGLRDVPETISKSVRRRCRAELKRLGLLLRRLIFLMALHVKPAPVKLRLGVNYFEKTDVETKPKPHFSLMPTQAGKAPDFLRGPITVPDRGPVLAAPLMDRWIAMLEVLRDSDRRARCLARTLQRQKAAGAPRPYLAPIPKTHAMHREVALVSGGLTVQLIEALRGWPEPDTS